MTLARLLVLVALFAACSQPPAQPPAAQPSGEGQVRQGVKQILNDAAGDSAPSYQGHERFWNLPLHESWTWRTHS